MYQIISVELHQYILKVIWLNKKLPNIYWTLKLYKNPTGARFKIAKPKCSAKPLLKDVATPSKQLYKQIENYNHITQYYSDVKLNWPDQINQAIIDIMCKLNSRIKAISISMFDLSNLNTSIINIQHHKLKSVMVELINFCFKGWQ